MDNGIKEILELISKDETLVSSYKSALNTVTHLNVSGLCEQQKGFMVSALSHNQSKKPVIIVSDYSRARMFSEGLTPFIDGDVVILQPSELSLVTAVASSRDSELQRISVISRLLSRDFGAAIICAGALLTKMPSAKSFQNRIIKLKLGSVVDPTELIKKLTTIGYERVGTVSAPGEFSARGDVVDIFSPDKNEPVRISFFDDEIDQIKTFDANTQRSTDSLRQISICPSSEVIIPEGSRAEIAKKVQLAAAPDINKMNASSRKSIAELLRRVTEADSDSIKEGLRVTGIARWLDVIIENPVTILDYVDKNLCQLFVDEMGECRSRIDGFTADYVARCKNSFETGSCPSCGFNAIHEIPEVMKRIDKSDSVVTLSCLQTTGNGLPGGKTINCTGLAGDNWRGRDRELASKVISWSKEGVIKFLITGEQRTTAFKVRMNEEGANADIIKCALPAGFIYPEIGLVLIGEQDIFGSEKKISKKRNSASKITFFGDIAPGDYVVHDAHGIGLYEGIVNMSVGNSKQDYLKITYAKGGVIYLPIDKLDKLSKYVGPAAREPKLSSLDSQEWNKSVEKARNSTKKLAFDLIKLYAARRANKGYSCEADDELQKQFEENFPYVETDDQLRAISDIKKDMESDIPMDRLLCGDVGFGKTEVAFRAIFKCVANGHQAFMLAPTTLLAQQHYENFKDRIKGFPIKVVLLSRFVPAAQMKKNIEDIKSGKADVVIGTHRILSKDIVPKKLGLLVVDEEQRFGVNHKEQIKAMKSNVDVLTLTATPIPRTLHMSMSGIRDISVLDEAPMNRRPVQTYVLGYDEEIVIQACQREIARGGQVFYLYNRTADIEDKANHLQSIMPGSRVLYAHGKMSEHQMERIIESFVAGEADILVCTTIIESGVDMPNVNTMIVEDSDRFGLAQLYQIKGRVGRSDKQAYAYITYDADKGMNSDARKRLMAIREFTELGSGVKIALRDLEVRGAGDLLGAEQHGQMNVIGYELYCRLLDEEIKLLRDGGDQEFMVAPEVSLEIDFDSYIPATYIPDEESRMVAYRRIASILDRKDYDDFIDEAMDRYGDPPREVYFLAGASLVRAFAAKAGFTRVAFKDNGILFYYATDRKMDQGALGKLIGAPEYAGRVMFTAQGTPYIHFKTRFKKSEQIVDEVLSVLEFLIANKTL